MTIAVEHRTESLAEFYQECIPHSWQNNCGWDGYVKIEFHRHDGSVSVYRPECDVTFAGHRDTNPATGEVVAPEECRKIVVTVEDSGLPGREPTTTVTTYQ